MFTMELHAESSSTESEELSRAHQSFPVMKMSIQVVPKGMKRKASAMVGENKLRKVEVVSLVMNIVQKFPSGCCCWV